MEPKLEAELSRSPTPANRRVGMKISDACESRQRAKHTAHLQLGPRFETHDARMRCAEALPPGGEERRRGWAALSGVRPRRCPDPVCYIQKHLGLPLGRWEYAARSSV